MAPLLYAEINILCFLIMLVITLKASVLNMEKTARNRLYFISMWLVMAANVLDVLWDMGLTKYWPLPPAVMTLIDILYFTAFGCAAYCWLLYAELVHRKGPFKHRYTYVLCAVPLLLLIVLLITSVFNGCLFWFDENGEYHRGKLFYAQQILSYGYIVAVSIKAFCVNVYRKLSARRGELVTLSYAAIPPIVFGVLQIFFQQLPILSVSIVVSYLLVYINSLEVLITLDPLTGVPNRRNLVRSLAESIRSLKAGEQLYFLFIDVDKFKQINDTYDHGEGDRILQAFAAALKDYVRQPGAGCGRYGGDEFALFRTVKRGEQSRQVVEDLQAALAKSRILDSAGSPVGVSIGCARYEGKNDSIPELISRADNQMYAIKAAKKEHSHHEREKRFLGK